MGIPRRGDDAHPVKREIPEPKVPPIEKLNKAQIAVTAFDGSYRIIPVPTGSSASHHDLRTWLNLETQKHQRLLVATIVSKQPRIVDIEPVKDESSKENQGRVTKTIAQIPVLTRLRLSAEVAVPDVSDAFPRSEERRVGKGCGNRRSLGMDAMRLE